MARYAIIDVSNLLGRAQHVARGDAFTKAGMAVHIIFQSLRKVSREMKADHLVFATDTGSWRYAIYPAYKARRRAKRAAMKPSEQEESAIFYEVGASMMAFIRDKTRCTVLSHPDIEADDFIARWIQLHPTDEHIIVSCDSDFVQLLDTNVSIFDGVQERLLSRNGVTDTLKGGPLAFKVDSASGKIKVQEPDPSFTPEPEWWRKALFVKIIRGDDGDGIFSAAPGASFKGTSKRTGIQQAWEDRAEKTFHWNNFMLQEWEKLVSFAPDGNKITERVRVIDEYRRNERLIDLTQQPQEIKERMDHAIAEALDRQPVNGVGFAFLKFCGSHDLPSLAGDSKDHVRYLSVAYPGL